MAVSIYHTGRLQTDLAKKSFSATILRLFPRGSAPLTALTALLKEETAVQIEHGFFSKTMLFPSAQMAASAASGDTTLEVVNSSNILPGMVLRVDGDDENILVTAVPDSTHLTVQRAFGTTGTNGEISASGGMLYMVGNAYEEASLRPMSQIIVPERVVNNTQIFRNTWTVSDSTRATQLIAGDSAVAESRLDCAAFHAADIEKATLFGQKFNGTLNGKPIRAMDGLESFQVKYAPTNITNLTSTTDYDDFVAALDVVANVGSDPKGDSDRMMFAGGKAINVLHEIFRKNSDYVIENGDPGKAFGMKFQEFKIPRMNFTVIEHPLLNAYGQSSTWAKSAFVVDLATFNHAYLSGRKTSAKEFNVNGQVVDNGVDAVGGTLTSELTTLVKNPAANAILRNFTAGAANSP